MPESLLTFDSFDRTEEPMIEVVGAPTDEPDEIGVSASEDEPPSAMIETFELIEPIETAAAAADAMPRADLPEVAPLTWTGAPTETGETLEQAVDAFLSGDRGARERIERIAAALRDRLALDPLADAVEALVREAGEPPNPGYIEVASAVINPAVASRIVQRMGRERDDVRRAEYFTLCRRLGRVMTNALKGALTGALEPGVRRVYYDAMISLGDTCRPVIEAMLEDENRFLVRDAVAMLGEIGGPRAVELVTSALADTDTRVRAEALHALAELGDADSGRLILGFLEDADSNVRLAAAVAAGKLGLERALRPLLNLLDDEITPAKQVRLLQALGDLGDPGAVPAIEKHASPSRFSKTSTDVRVAAYRALHSIGTPHARELVRRAANDKDAGVRAALRGLVQEP
jgi:HEAT repeat protein